MVLANLSTIERPLTENGNEMMESANLPQSRKLFRSQSTFQRQGKLNAPILERARSHMVPSPKMDNESVPPSFISTSSDSTSPNGRAHGGSSKGSVGSSSWRGDKREKRYPDSKTLTDFFGTVVEGAEKRPSITRKLSEKVRRKSKKTAEANETTPPPVAVTTRTETPAVNATPSHHAPTTPSPIREMHWGDPMMRELSIEELMMSRYNLKPEEALCLVADARTNVGSTKWEPWTETLYLECEKLYEESYKPRTKKATQYIPIRPDGVPVISMAPPLPSAQEFVMANPYNFSDDISSWGSQSGWSALWDDDNSRLAKLGGGFSLRTHDDDDLYTIGVIQEMQKKAGALQKQQQRQQQQEERNEQQRRPQDQQQHYVTDSGVECMFHSPQSPEVTQSPREEPAPKKIKKKRRFFSFFFGGAKKRSAV